MRQFGKWLIHDEQKQLFDHLFAAALNLILLAVLMLLFWPLGRIAFPIRLLKGFWVFWILLPLTALLLFAFRRVFRIDMYSHFNTYVISSLIVSCVLQTGWSAFAALTVRNSIAAAPWWLVVITYISGALTCFVTLTLLGAYYTGSIYRQFNALVGAISFVLFSVWPSAPRVLFGWFFDLF